MPQLNPSPWFITLLTAWFIICILLTPKLFFTQFPNKPHKNTRKPTTSTWYWPWY